MIEDYYVPCELFTPVETVDNMNVKTLVYSKTADITGTIIEKNTKVLIDNVYTYKNVSLFVTGSTVNKDDRIKLEGVLYNVDGIPSNIMFRNHHFEFPVSAVI